MQLGPWGLRSNFAANMVDCNFQYILIVDYAVPSHEVPCHFHLRYKYILLFKVL